MTEVLSAAQMRRAEQAAIAAGDVSGLDLMERAGQGVVAAVMARYPALAVGWHHARVLCGPGNNGGDGFVVARLLTDRGWRVTVHLHGDADSLPPDAAINCARWQAMGGIRPLDEAREGFGGAPVDLVVDAVFGTGLSRPLDRRIGQPLADVGDWCRGRANRPPVVAVDVPSGLCSDSGRDMGAGFACDLTVTFHRAKTGHYLADGPALCGSVEVVDIGLPPGDMDGAYSGDFVTLVTSSDVTRKRQGHKFAHGHALILSGGPGRTGAARLAARGALRIGAGLVTLGVPPAAQLEVAAQITAIMLARVADAQALRTVLTDERITALCLGPGFGTGERERKILAEVLRVPDPDPGPRGGAGGPGSGPGRRCAVLDADALTLLADYPDLFDALHETCVLTPHGGEFARLFPDIAKTLGEDPDRGPARSKVDATREAARRAGCVVLFKGPDTVIAAPDGRCSINAAHYDRAAPWMATAGAGDVLAGFIAGLLARGVAPMRAAETAAWLHVECARLFGPGLIAEDLPELLPRALRDQGS